MHAELTECCDDIFHGMLLLHLSGFVPGFPTVASRLIYIWSTLCPPLENWTYLAEFPMFAYIRAAKFGRIEHF